MQKILIIGSSNTDMVIRSEKLPRPGETVLGGHFLMNPGGKGANQAVAAARLGASVSFITKLGNDVFGNELKALFTKEGMDMSGVLTDNELPSGIALINVDKQGENSISVAAGSNANLSGNDIEQLKHLLDESAFVLMQLEIPLPTVEFATEYAKSKGKKVVINPAPAAVLSDKMLKNLFAITPNETEAELLTGVAVNDEKSAFEASKILFDKGVKHVVITMGSQGAFLFNHDFAGLIPAPKVKAVDTTAADDVFNGAFVVALSEGKFIRDAVAFACKAASIAVTRYGAQASAPYRNEM